MYLIKINMDYSELASDLKIDLSETDHRWDVRRYTDIKGASLFSAMIDMLYCLDSFTEEDITQCNYESLGVEEMTCIPYADDLLSLMYEEGLVTSDDAGNYEMTDEGKFLLQLHYRCG